MRKRSVLFLIPALFALSTAVCFAFFFNLIDTNFGINANGSASPSIPIQQNGDLYTFTGNSQAFTIKRSNIVIEGNGYNSSLIRLDHVTNVTIKNLQLKASHGYRAKNAGIAMYLDNSSNNIIFNCNAWGDSLNLHFSHNNTITNNTDVRVWLEDSNRNVISYNVLAGGVFASVELRNGVNNLILRNNATKISLLFSSSNNLIFGNRINNASWNWLFINKDSSHNLFVGNEIVGPFMIESLINCTDNLFYHNNFINAFAAKYQGVEGYPSLVSMYPANKWNRIDEGNYWRNYSGQDLNNDGIGDTPCIINAFNQDNYPLMNPLDLSIEPIPKIS